MTLWLAASLFLFPAGAQTITFADITSRSGIRFTHNNGAYGKKWLPETMGPGCAFVDYDNDGWPDILLVNGQDWPGHAKNGSTTQKLYHNNHNGTFSDVAVMGGIAFSESGRVRAGMGTDAGDYDNSGCEGLLIGNFTNESMSLYHNDGSGLFTDEAPKSGLSQMTNQALTFGAFFFDYDLDGLLDVFAANGHVSDDISVVQPTVKYAQPAGLYRNKDGTKFEDVSAKLGRAIQKAIVGRGAAYADFDNDGDLDLAVTANSGPARLLRNDNANQNDTLRVKTIGTRSNRDGIGAKLTLKTNKGVRLFAMVKSGSSYLSQSELPVTFGLGKPEDGKISNLEIVWPSGQRDSIANIKPNQFITIKESKGIITAKPISFAKASGLSSSPVVPQK